MDGSLAGGRHHCSRCKIRLNLWNNEFFNALAARDWNAFVGTMSVFAFLAAASIGVAGYQVYLKQLLRLR
jgi:vitamin B12/bleomycin/antimicrobial peptide transport system ATP-binding/permease protein